MKKTIILSALALLVCGIVKTPAELFSIESLDVNKSMALEEKEDSSIVISGQRLEDYKLGCSTYAGAIIGGSAPSVAQRNQTMRLLHGRIRECAVSDNAAIRLVAVDMAKACMILGQLVCKLKASKYESAISTMTKEVNRTMTWIQTVNSTAFFQSNKANERLQKFVEKLYLDANMSITPKNPSVVFKEDVAKENTPA
ncbi:MAG: hypothetical protein LBB12_02645 [Holosporaceae bacterium]|jgi:hypothetical protein|nr:hypothetical protein [Holosporaceae bacterium]